MQFDRNNLSECFLQYTDIKKRDETVPQGFWQDIPTDGTPNAIRKRFKRRYKTLNSKDVVARHDYIKKLADEFEANNTDHFLNTLLDILRGEKSFRQNDNEITEKTNFSKQAEDMGVGTEYQQFLKRHKIHKDDVSMAYFKEKGDGSVNFTVQTRSQEKPDFDPAEAFRQSIAEYEIPSSTLDKPTDTTEKAAVINLFDAHLDKVCSLDDSDSEASLESNVNDFETAFNDLLLSVKTTKPERIIIPVGNDTWHTNDFRLTTKKGTSMADRVHTSGMEAFRIGLDMLRRCIDKSRQIANVTLVPVPANHDHSRVNYLLECLLIAYENQDDVTVIDNHRDRKYIRYGKWLWGFSHGDKRYKAADLTELMATDKQARKHWAEIDKGVFFLGHVHHEKKYDYMKSNDFRGVKVMFLRSVGPNDEWHWANGYTAIPKTAYAFIYSKDGKREQEFKVNI